MFYLRKFSESFGKDSVLKIEPWAWLQCFQESRTWDPNKILKRFLGMLADAEAKIAIARKFPARRFETIATEDIHRPYKSERSGKKMLCLSNCRAQRVRFIQWAKGQIFLARQSYKDRTAGNYLALPPAGFFLPGGALLANLLKHTLPL